jgi:pyruvate dehydrogenase E1 component alpha subunit
MVRILPDDAGDGGLGAQRAVDGGVGAEPSGADGSARHEFHAPAPHLWRCFYRDMALARRFDGEAGALQRQGQLGLWVSCAGQEAAQVGSAHALERRDMVFPSYREHAVALIRGVEPLAVASLFRGVDFGGWDPSALRFHLYTLVLATQTLHAVGYARGIQMEQRRWPATAGREAVIVYLGDGAASEGDASEAMSWAAVDRLPLVFLCQNNQWAISTPVSRQARVPLHRRAAGFGMPGVLVDGNDVLAVHAVTRAAMDRARAGGGPTFIEAHTYRLEGHSSADDPTRYRGGDEVARWRSRDPLVRLRRHLEAGGLAAPEFFDQVDGDAELLAGRLRAGVPVLPEPALDRLAGLVFAGAGSGDRPGPAAGRR